MDTGAFNFVLGTDFFVQHSHILSLTLQAPYVLQVDHGDGWESVPLEQSEHTSSYLRVCKREPSTMMVTSKTEDYQLLGDVLDQGLRELGYSREDLNVELFASDEQHVLDLYCSKGQNCCYKFYWPSFGMAYGNPRFSELGKVLTKVALERSCMVLCSTDWGSHGGYEYWRTPLDNLTLTSVQLPDDAIYVPLGRKTPIRKPGRGSMLSVVDGSLAPVPREDRNSAMGQEIQRESSGFTLDVLKNQLQPRDAVETTPGGEEYIVSDTGAPNPPCRVSNPDVVSALLHAEGMGTVEWGGIVPGTACRWITAAAPQPMQSPSACHRLLLMVPSLAPQHAFTRDVWKAILSHTREWLTNQGARYLPGPVLEQLTAPTEQLNDELLDPALEPLWLLYPQTHIPPAGTSNRLGRLGLQRRVEAAHPGGVVE